MRILIGALVELPVGGGAAVEAEGLGHRGAVHLALDHVGQGRTAPGRPRHEPAQRAADPNGVAEVALDSV